MKTPKSGFPAWVWHQTTVFRSVSSGAAWVFEFQRPCYLRRGSAAQLAIAPSFLSLLSVSIVTDSTYSMGTDKIKTSDEAEAYLTHVSSFHINDQLLFVSESHC